MLSVIVDTVAIDPDFTLRGNIGSHLLECRSEGIEESGGIGRKVLDDAGGAGVEPDLRIDGEQATAIKNILEVNVIEPEIGGVKGGEGIGSEVWGASGTKRVGEEEAHVGVPDGV